MSRSEQLGLAYIMLFLVMVILIAFAWLMLGALTERHTWRYRLFQWATAAISALALMLGYYLWLGSGRPLLDDVLRLIVQ